MQEYTAATVGSLLVIACYNVFLVNLLQPVYNLSFETLSENNGIVFINVIISAFITLLFFVAGIAQVMLFLLVINRYFFLMLVGVFWLCLSGGFMAYAINEFNAEINTSNLFNIFNSNYSETFQFISASLYYYLFISLLVAIVLIALLSQTKKENKPFILWLFLILAFVCSFASSLYIYETFTSVIIILLFITLAYLLTRYDLSLKGILGFTIITVLMLFLFLLNKSILPLNLIHELIVFEHKRAELQKLLSSPKENIAEIYPSVFKNEYEPLTVVLIVGESARSDHIGINGYRRNTTPKLAERSNLLSFSKVFSCGIVTRTSIPCMFTRADKAEDAIGFPETTLISFFNKHGFHTEWIDMHPFANFFHAPISPLASEANEQVFLNKDITNKLTSNTLKKSSNDLAILDLFEKRISSINGNQLYVLVTLGSHWQYALRYPHGFSLFTPECKAHTPAKCSNESLVNAYDNSILFTDYIIDEIISLVEDRNALVVYTSDHGQSLGENGKYIHNHPNEINNYHVPFIIWYSNLFGANYPELIESLRSKTNKIVTHRHYFHSILDCTGFKSNAINKNLSICDNNFIEGEVPLEK